MEKELIRKVQLLETELAMEKLLLQDQRTSNGRLQQQVFFICARVLNLKTKSSCFVDFFLDDAINCKTEEHQSAGKNPAATNNNFLVPISTTRTSRKGSQYRCLFYVVLFVFVNLVILSYLVPSISRTKVGEHAKKFDLPKKISE